MTGRAIPTRAAELVYQFTGGWMRCQKCGRTLALVAPDKPKRHRCDPSLPDQKWSIRV